MTGPAPQIDLLRAPELGNSSFLVSDLERGEAVAIDPLRDVAQYLDRAERQGGRITPPLDTPGHNDFVSGSRELQAEVGAAIGAAEDCGLQCRFRPLAEGSEVAVGRWRLRTRRSPGHTPNHVSYLLLDADDRPLA